MPIGAAPILAIMPTTRSSLAPRSIASTTSRRVCCRSLKSNWAAAVSGTSSMNDCSKLASRIVFDGTLPLVPITATNTMASPISHRAPKMARNRTINLDMDCSFLVRKSSLPKCGGSALERVFPHKYSATNPIGVQRRFCIGLGQRLRTLHHAPEYLIEYRVIDSIGRAEIQALGRSRCCRCGGVGLVHVYLRNNSGPRRKIGSFDKDVSQRSAEVVEL